MLAFTTSEPACTPAQIVRVLLPADLSGIAKRSPVAWHSPVETLAACFSPSEPPSVHENDTTPAETTGGGTMLPDDGPNVALLVSCGQAVGTTSGSPPRLEMSTGRWPLPEAMLLALPYVAQSLTPVPVSVVNASGASNVPQALAELALQGRAVSDAGRSAAHLKPIVPARSYRSSIRKSVASSLAGQARVWHSESKNDLAPLTLLVLVELGRQAPVSSQRLRQVPATATRAVVGATAQDDAPRVAVGVLVCHLPDVPNHRHQPERAIPRRRVLVDRLGAMEDVARGHGRSQRCVVLLAPWEELCLSVRAVPIALPGELPLNLCGQPLAEAGAVGLRLRVPNVRHLSHHHTLL